MATYSQHHTKWRITETFQLKIRKKKGLSSFSTPIQYSFEIPSQSSKTRARNKRDSRKEGEIKLSLFANDPIPKRLQKLYQKTT
jgi:hypothetical protein